MTSSVTSLPSVQISTVTRSGGPAPFCCNDPGCPCQGGKEAKAALDLRRQQENLDDVRISSQALQLLASERPAEVGPALTTQAVSPAGASLEATFSSRASADTTPATLSLGEASQSESPAGISAGQAPPSVSASSPPTGTAASNDPFQRPAYQTIQQLAETDRNPPPIGARVDTYA